MKRFFLSIIVLGAIMQPLCSLEVTTLLHGGNILFDKEKEAVETSLSGTDYYYGLSVYGNQQIDENITLHAGIKYDPVLRYTTYTTIEFARDFYQIEVGPFFGIFNSWNPVMKSGISTSIRFDYPGVAFASLRSDSSIAARFTKAGDYMQEHNQISVGYYIPHAICSLNLTTKRYVSQQTKNLEVDDSFTEYSFEVDIFQKNVPVRVLLSFAYQQLERIYPSSTNSLNSMVFGTDFRIEVSPKITLLARIDSNIYSFGKAGDGSLSLPDSGVGMYLFRSELGAEIYF
ncbi:MAG: hypothetical protein U5P10_01150 [Spirochaetia bacterium]|nr:hypothetical protein [Spirochaetia bacterium]